MSTRIFIETLLIIARVKKEQPYRRLKKKESNYKIHRKEQIVGCTSNC